LKFWRLGSWALPPYHQRSQAKDERPTQRQHGGLFAERHWLDSGAIIASVARQVKRSGSDGGWEGAGRAGNIAQSGCCSSFPAWNRWTCGCDGVPANAYQFLATTEFALLEIVFAECGICMRVCMGVQVVASKLYIRWVLGGTRSRAELVWLVVSDILL